MINESYLRRLSCYAVIKSGYTGNSLLFAHMRLVLALIAKKAYTRIDATVLVNDFPNEYGYGIDYFAMRQILGVVSLKRGNSFLVQKKHSDYENPNACGRM